MELDADAAAVGAGMVAIVEAPDVIYSQDREDVVKPHARFHVGLARHRQAGDIGREKEERS